MTPVAHSVNETMLLPRPAMSAPPPTPSLAARQAEEDARAETKRVRDDAAREREALRDSCGAQLDAQRALTDAERARAERAETELATERADRRKLTSHITDNSDHGSTASRRGKSGGRGSAAAAASRSA
jgi:hypothetical protein